MTTFACILFFLSWISSEHASKISPEDDAFGKVKFLGKERIVGGLITEPNRYPFMIYLYIEGQGGSTSCGAALLNELYAITAAHCVKRQNGVEVESVKAQLGYYNIELFSERSRQDVDVERWFIHKNFNPKTFVNDIAILQLSHPVKLTAHVDRICIPPSLRFYTEGEVRTLGWGVISYLTKQRSDKLREVDLEIMPDSKCERLYAHQFHPTVMLCIGHAHGWKDACLGDSGGPVFVYDLQDKPTLIGLTSFAKQGCGFPGIYAVYTKVAAFTHWIESKTADGGTPVCYGDYKDYNYLV